jgi:hypothetical protein
MAQQLLGWADVAAGDPEYCDAGCKYPMEFIVNRRERVCD